MLLINKREIIMYGIRKTEYRRSVWFWLDYLTRLFAVAQSAAIQIRKGEAVDPNIFETMVVPDPRNSVGLGSGQKPQWFQLNTKRYSK
jgi:hypothetical protein